MRVVHAIPGLDPSLGGPPVALTGLATAQRRAGLEVEVVCCGGPDEDRQLADAMRQGGVEVRIIPARSTWLGAGSQLKQAVEQAVGRAQVCHIHGLWMPVQTAAGRAAAALQRPYVIRPCGMLDPWPMQQGWLKKRVYLALQLRRILDAAAALHFTAIAEREGARLLRLKAPAIIEPNGVDLTPFATLPDPGRFRQAQPGVGDGAMVLFMSRLHPKKGLELLIPAFAQAAADGATLVIAGSGEPGYTRDLHALVERHGLEGRVVFTGMLQGEQKLAALVDADLFVLPSYHENFGVAVAEALAAGKPVLISDKVAIHRELVEAGIAEAVPTKVEPLAAALRRWMRAGESRGDLGARARRFVHEHYDWDLIAQRWVGHYERIVAGE